LLFVNTFVTLISLPIIFFPLGFFLINKLNINFRINNTYTLFIISACFGVTISIPILLTFSLFRLNSILVLLLFVVPIYYMRNYINRIKFNNIPRLFCDLLFHLIIVAYLSNFITYQKWPPAGDVITLHGPLITLISNYGKLPLQNEKILLLYPPGLHALVSSLNLIFNYYSGELLYVFMGFIMSMIILSAYLYFSKHIGVLTSFVSFLIAIKIPQSGRLIYWVFGAFLNGTYPSLFGILILLIYFIFMLELDMKFEFDSFIIISIIFGMSALVTYPPYSVLMLLYFGLIVVIKYKQLEKKHWYVFLFLILLFMISFVLYSYGYNYAVMLVSYLKGSFYLNGVGIGGNVSVNNLPLSFLLESFSFKLTMLGFLIGLYYQIKNLTKTSNLFYLLCVFLVILDSAFNLFMLKYLQTNKLILFISVLTPYIVLYYSVELLNKKSIKLNILTRYKLTIFRTHFLTLFIFALLLLSNNYDLYFDNDQIKSWGWFTHTNSFEDDRYIIEWISENVNTNDLILNDMSYDGMSIWSYSLQNVTHNLWMKNVYRERFIDLQTILDDPTDVNSTYHLLKKYNVSYVFVSAEWGHQMYGDPYWYQTKKYSPSQIVRVFDAYPFLESIIESGNAKLYKINDINYNLSIETEIDISNISSELFWNSTASWNEGGSISNPIKSNNSSILYIPPGDNYCFGLYHIKKYNFTTYEVIKLKIYSDSEIGLTLKLWDVFGGYNLYNFKSNANETVNIYLYLNNPDDSGTLDYEHIGGIAISTGLIRPLPDYNQVLDIQTISLINVQNN